MTNNIIPIHIRNVKQDNNDAFMRLSLIQLYEKDSLHLFNQISFQKKHLEYMKTRLECGILANGEETVDCIKKEISFNLRMMDAITAKVKELAGGQ